MSVYTDQPLQETPVPRLLRGATGIEPKAQEFVFFAKSSRVSSTQRLRLYDVGGGLALFTWPAELMSQAKYLYERGRAPRLLGAASEVVGMWKRADALGMPLSEIVFMAESINSNHADP